MSDLLKIFCILLAIELCQSSVDYLKNIRDDYCIKYCPNKECLVNKIDGNHKKCIQTNNKIYTEKYELQLKDQSLTLYWKTDKIDFDALIQLNSAPNKTNIKLKELKIYCETIKQSQLLHRFQFQNGFGIKQLDIFNTEYENSNQVLVIINETLHLSLNHFLGEINSSFWNDFIMESTDKYNTIRFTGNSIETFTLCDKIFSNQTDLQTLEFRNIKIENLTAAVFENLTTLKTLNFIKTDVPNNSFLSSLTLQQNLINIRLPEEWTENMKILAHFKKLEIIMMVTFQMNGFQRIIENENQLKAIVCVEDYAFNSKCYFTRGINNVTCPKKCNCYLESFTRQLFVNCTGKGLDQIPTLPIPIRGNVNLYFENNTLSKLPNISSIDYTYVQELHLKNNKIEELRIDNLPPHLRYLDIRNNSINSFDNKVAEFFWNIKNKLTFLQAGILWKCNCKNNAFVKYLDHLQKKRNVIPHHYGYHSALLIQNDPVHHYQLKGPCPDNCLCCFNSTIKHFIIDCRNLSLNEFPVLQDHIIGDSSILLDNNLLTYLPNLRNSELRQLHLSNNHLTELWINHLPLNLTFLDISNNNLEGIDNDLMTFLEKKKIHILGNPLRCSCQFKKMLTYLKNNKYREYKSVLKKCSGSEYCPKSCFCCMEEDTNLYNINCNNQQLQHIPRMPNIYNIKLIFERNNLNTLMNSTEGFNNIKELHLKLNKIKEIVSLPSNISHLDISNNSMTKLSDSVLETLSELMPTINMSGNNWICHCDELRFLKYTKQYAINITDLCHTECSNSNMLVKVDEKDVCSNGIPIFAFVFILLMILGSFLNWLQFFWKSISMWLYENNVIGKIFNLRKLDNNKKYDCFLAYCHKDSDFLQDYIDILENEPSNLRLCYYARDWLPGEPIPACICKSVEESKRIIILMTNNFLKSVWGRLEFRMALHATAKDKCKRLIVVVYSDVENFDDLDSELKTYMKLNTYLKRDDPNFWDKLIIAMPKNIIESNNIEFTSNAEADDMNEVVEIELSNL